jgi:hypothetical protein
MQLVSEFCGRRKRRVLRCWNYSRTPNDYLHEYVNSCTGVKKNGNGEKQKVASINFIEIATKICLALASFYDRNYGLNTTDL